jgi:hypothetical protein
MVLTKQELIGSLNHEVNILLHLASKLDAKSVDYRPAAKQRSSLELLKYLSIMGPQTAAEARNLEQTLEAIKGHAAIYADEIGAMSDADFRTAIEMFGNKTTKGAFIVNLVLGGCAAYRTQLFLYLKACGREELNTMNLWAGVDPAPAAG